MKKLKHVKRSRMVRVNEVALGILTVRAVAFDRIAAEVHLLNRLIAGCGAASPKPNQTRATRRKTEG